MYVRLVARAARARTPSRHPESGVNGLQPLLDSVPGCCRRGCRLPSSLTLCVLGGAPELFDERQRESTESSRVTPLQVFDTGSQREEQTRAHVHRQRSRKTLTRLLRGPRLAFWTVLPPVDLLTLPGAVPNPFAP